MKNKIQKRCVLSAMVMLLVASCFATLIQTAEAQNSEKTIYLKGAGKNTFDENWNNLFYTGGTDEYYPNPSLWHLVYTGDINKVTAMKITFTNDATFEWNPQMGFSANPAGNNLGWVIVAPYDWEIDYINKGNNNKSESYVTTTDLGNPQFNISDNYVGKDPREFPVPEYALGGLIALSACFVALGAFCVSKNVRSKAKSLGAVTL